MVRLAWRDRWQPEQPRRIEHSVVIGHDGFEIITNGHGRRKMDGVEGSENLRCERAGRVQNPVVDADEVDPAQAFPDRRQRIGAQVADRAQGFNPQQG